MRKFVVDNKFVSMQHINQKTEYSNKQIDAKKISSYHKYNENTRGRSEMKKS